MNPVALSSDLRETYIRYVLTRFPLGKKDPELRDKLFSLLRSEKAGRYLFRGPILELMAPYEQTISLNELSLKNPSWKQLCEFFNKNQGFDCARKLYSHQELALLQSENNNLVIASGTGSGKTECFLLPIIKYCLAKQGKGVRAILVYPLNALVEDQLLRLAKYLNGSQVTFGKYTGQTPRKATPSDKLCPNHLTGRDEMRSSPPNILITNYAMLEYLLLRPGDSQIINSTDEHAFRFIVLDEAHTYTGAAGNEIAFLLRRLQYRTGRRPTDLRCFATSATLGTGNDTLNKTAVFAERLFGTPFSDKNIITGTRINISNVIEFTETYSIKAIDIVNLSDETNTIISDFPDNLFRLCSFIPPKGASVAVQIFSLFTQCKEIKQIITQLEENHSLSIESLAGKLFPDCESSVAMQAVVRLIAWSQHCISPDTGIPLLPVRYHMFVSKTKGLFCELSTDPNTRWVRLALSQQGIRELPNNPYPFEIAVCRICGEPYIFGVFVKLQDGSMKYKPQADTFFEQLESEFDEAQNKILCFSKPRVPATEYAICKICGVVNSPCNHDVTQKVHLFAMDGESEINTDETDPGDDSDDDTVTGCINCSAGRSLGRVILPLRLPENGSSAPLVSTFYSHCPPLSKAAIDSKHKEYQKIFGIRSEEWTPITGNGRKLLLFSDSRQNAAYFGPYVQVTHTSLLFSKFMISLLDKNKSTPLSEWKERGINNLKSFHYNHENSTFLLSSLRPRPDFFNELILREEETKLKHRIYHAICSLIGREGSMVSGLEGCGIAAVHVSDSSISEHISINGLTKHQVMALVQLVVRYIRMSEAFMLSPEENLNLGGLGDVYYGQLFDRIVLTSFLDTSSKSNILRLVSKRPNRLQHLIEKSLCRFRNIGSVDQDEINNVIISIADTLKGRELKLVKNNGFQLNVNALCITLADISDGSFLKTIPGALPRLKSCLKCGRLSWIDINDMCNYPGCNGTLTDPSQTLQFSSNNHYRHWFLSSNTHPELRAAEHTAQLDKQTAARDYQDEFKDGRLNILSCSTTFEMGVDLGDLSAVFLRNVPPSIASYVQRAGRAGRRAGLTPFVLTFCRALPHDQYFFDSCDVLVRGIVSAPALVLENEKILTRHLKAITLSKFMRQYKPAFAVVGSDGYLKDPHCCDIFDNNISFSSLVAKEHSTLVPVRYLCEIWFNQHKKELFDEFSVTFAQSFKNNPAFVSSCFDSFPSNLISDDRYGLVGAAFRDYSAMIAFYKAQIAGLDPVKKSDRNDYDYYASMLSQTQEDQLISYLSSRGALPSYAFPTDVVPLRILSDREGAKLLDLNRELGRAISEYAPGSMTVANARVYTSGALHKYSRLQFKVYYYRHCSVCHWFRYTENKDELFLKNVCDCGATLDGCPNTALLPEWGFAVPRDMEAAPIRKNTHLSRAGFSSELYMDEKAFPNKSPYLVDCANGKATLEYANGYKMVRINRGPNDLHNRKGFWICKDCGRSLSSNPSTHKKHKTPYLGDCNSSNIIGPTHLISFFDTDALRISFSECPPIPGVARSSNFHFKSFWRSILYSLIESLSTNFNIDRDDIDGIFLPGNPFSRIVLIDSVSGGAGHVARLIGKDGSNISSNVRTLLSGAVSILSCRECAEDAACYSCLFHATNQQVQHTLNRSLAKEWLAKIT